MIKSKELQLPGIKDHPHMNSLASANERAILQRENVINLLGT